ncbi:hypothetical protein [Nocardia thraciensis]
MDPEPRPYLVRIEPVPDWDDTLYDVFAITIDGRKVPIGKVVTDDGQFWRRLDTTTHQPTGDEYSTADQAADALADAAYTAWKKAWDGIPHTTDTAE